jgi:hypothetical protein
MLYIFILCQGFSKLLICGGNKPGIDTCEVLNLNSSATTCQNPPNLPQTVYAAIEGLGFKENPIICGGWQSNLSYSDRCYSLENNEWLPYVSMTSRRVDTVAAQLPDGKLLVAGGPFLSSAEILIGEEWISNIPSLPVYIVCHCMVTVNSTSVMAIAGEQKSESSGKTFYFTFGEESWIEGPELNYKRNFQSCGKIRRDTESEEMSIIVAGGSYAGSYLSSVEILDDGSDEWKTGPELPFGLRYSQVAEDQNGGVVLIGGESNSIANLDTLFQLPHAGQDAMWTKMEQKLKTGRSKHTATLVPDTIVDCS